MVKGTLSRDPLTGVRFAAAPEQATARAAEPHPDASAGTGREAKFGAGVRKMSGRKRSGANVVVPVAEGAAAVAAASGVEGGTAAAAGEGAGPAAGEVVEGSPSVGPDGAEDDEGEGDGDGDEDGDDDDDEGERAGGKGAGGAKHPNKRNTQSVGRRKIKIQFIEDKPRRHVTFTKRKSGLMKKAFELSTLTGTDCLVLVVSESGLVYTFSTPALSGITDHPRGKEIIQASLRGELSVDQSPEDGAASGTGASPSPAVAGTSASSKKKKGKAPRAGSRDAGAPSASPLPPPPQPIAPNPHQHPDPHAHPHMHHHPFQLDPALGSSSSFELPVPPPLPPSSASSSAPLPASAPYYPSPPAPPPAHNPHTQHYVPVYSLPGPGAPLHAHAGMHAPVTSWFPSPLLPAASQAPQNQVTYASPSALAPAAEDAAAGANSNGPGDPAEGDAAAPASEEDGDGPRGVKRKHGAHEFGEQAQQWSRRVRERAAVSGPGGAEAGTGAGGGEGGGGAQGLVEEFERFREQLAAASPGAGVGAGQGTLPDRAVSREGATETETGAAKGVEIKEEKGSVPEARTVEERRLAWRTTAAESLAAAKRHRTVPALLLAHSHSLYCTLPVPPQVDLAAPPYSLDDADTSLHHQSFARMCARAGVEDPEDVPLAAEEFLARWMPRQLASIPAEFRPPALAHARASFLAMADFLDAHALAGARVCAALEMLRSDGKGGWAEGDERRRKLYED